MKNARLWLSALLLSMALSVSACGESTPDTTEENSQEQEETSVDEEQPDQGEEEPSEPSEDISDEGQDSQISESHFSLSDIEPYSGGDETYLTINNNISFFSDEDLTTESYEYYSDLDGLGRCGVAHACIGLDLMPTEERGNIGQVKPSGWHTVKYDIVSGKYLYNRCHLIGYQLSGENANEKNLITGTRYLNVDGMLPFENMVADYVKETENHVMYRVTPYYDGDNLVASGVLMEAESVEDKGEDIQFCVYCYNVQPGITIDYATGDSWLDGEAQTSSEQGQDQQSQSVPNEQPQEEVPQESVESEPEVVQEPTVTEPEPQGTTYVLNTNTKKFHVPSCYTINQMKESNKQIYTGNRDDVIAQGYDPCKKCNP